MKKLLTVLATLLVAGLAGLALVSCGDTGQKLTQDEAKLAEKYDLTKLNDSVKNKSIDLFVYKAADPFISGSVVPGFKNALANVGFETIKVLDANANQDIQNGQIRTALGSQDVLIVNSATPLGATGPIDLVKSTKKPLVFFNREMQDDQIKKYDNAWFVGTDRNQPGELQGQFVAEQVIKNFKAYDKDGNGKIGYIILKGEAGNPEAEGRTTAAKVSVVQSFVYLYNKLDSSMKNADHFGSKFDFEHPEKAFEQIAADYVSNPVWDAAFAKNTVQSALAAEKKPEAIFSNNDGMALGALEALKANKYNLGFNAENELDLSKTILLTGVDGLKNAQEAVAKGQMSFSVLQDGKLLGAVTTQVAVNLLNGEKNPFTKVLANEAFKGTFVDKACNQKLRVPYSPISVKVAREMLDQNALNPEQLSFEKLPLIFDYNENATAATVVEQPSVAENNSTTPAENNSTTPAENNSTTPAENNSTTPAENNSTTPAENNSTTPAENNSTTPAENNSTTPAENNSTTPAE